MKLNFIPAVPSARLRFSPPFRPAAATFAGSHEAKPRYLGFGFSEEAFSLSILE